MKKLILLFLFISAFAFGQEKTLFKAVSYNKLIELYNQKLKLQNEDLSSNIERCKFIIADAKSKDDADTETVWTIFLKGLQQSQTIQDKNAAFIKIYSDPTSYNFYDFKDNFVGRISKEKFDEQILINGNNTETYVSNYFYLSQE